MTSFELFLGGAIFVIALLLLALFLRRPPDIAGLQARVEETLRRQQAAEALLARLEGQVQSLNSQLETRLHGLTQNTVQRERGRSHPQPFSRKRARGASSGFSDFHVKVFQMP
jgi:hypothetical protein